MGVIDWRLHVITAGREQSTVMAAAAAARAGAGVIQVRDKAASTEELLAVVCRVADAVAAVSAHTTVLVNDRVEVAVAARGLGAAVHGVHLGQRDAAVADARAALGAGALVGLTAGTVAFVREAEQRRGAHRPDYLGAGPFRRTPTKDVGRMPIGVLGYRVLADATSIPVIAVGGVRRDDVADLASTGVAGVAVVREVMAAVDPGAAAAGILAAWG
ncbi:MAG: thiamine phosphate synthase [Dermatophilaceae bacterium]